MEVTRRKKQSFHSASSTPELAERDHLISDAYNAMRQSLDAMRAEWPEDHDGPTCSPRTPGAVRVAHADLVLAMAAIDAVYTNN